MRSQGISATEILALAKLEYPQSELEVVRDLEILRDQWHSGKVWRHNSELEVSLLRCSSLIFLHPEQTANLSVALKDLLGTVYYHYLIVFLGYIKLCHQWVRSNQNIEHQQDRRSQLHLGSLLLEKIELAQFLTAEVKSAVPLVTKDLQTAIAQEHLDDLAELITSHSAVKPVKVSLPNSLPNLRQKTLTTCLANAPFPVMIHNQQGEIIHLNRNWLEASGYDVQEISTIKEWQQKAQISQREIVRLPAKNSSQLYRKYVAPAHQTALEATTALQQIVNSLIDIAPEVIQTRIKPQKKLADAIRSEVTVATKWRTALLGNIFNRLKL
ncbi:MAG: hypothetical protein HC930_11185 [Hydrococcus sp. SU_1_0]|nr:hypothetical protein [Hydrococcus sp. SU_1_0]